jgi:predicted Zn-dependent peptidase
VIRLGAVGLALLLWPAAALAQPQDIGSYVLGNGVRLLVREDRAAGVVAVSVQVRAGSRFEQPETTGITNFLHRAMLRGAGRRSATDLVEAAERIGGSLDASGDVEYAEVRGSAIARHWDTLLALVADVALAPTLPADEVDRERRLILSQIQTRADNPFSFAWDRLIADLYGPHPYGQPSLGRSEVVTRLRRDDLVAHHRAVYRPDQLVVAVSGRVEREPVRRAVERLFGKMPTEPAQAAAPPPAPMPSHRRQLVERPAQQAQFLVGFLGPALGQPDYAASRVLGALMGGGMGGRLFVEVRDNLGLAYSVGVIHRSWAGPTPFVAYMGTAKENIGAAESAMLRELERVGTEGVTEAELARAKAYLAGNLAMDRRTNARHAWYLAFYEVVGVGWDYPDRFVRAVEMVTASDVQAAGQRYLTRPSIFVLQPR